MSRSRCTFRQRDVTRALRACIVAGVKAQRAEIDPVSGKIVIVLCDDGPATASEGSALDAWRAGRGAR